MTMDLSDTIAAISTPLGESGIGIVRLSGSDSLSIAGRLFFSSTGKSIDGIDTHTINYGYIKDPESGEVVDEVLLTVMRAPRTYTREDIVEINCHGGFFPLRQVLELVLEGGARLAEPGEFTQRAFLNGRIDLAQAEAVIDLIKAKAEVSMKVAMEQLKGKLSAEISELRRELLSLLAHLEALLDFPEDEIEELDEEELIGKGEDISNRLGELIASFEEGRIVREGLKVAIVGKPNVGKSSLLNALLEEERAIVTPFPGTTRDTIEEYLNIRGLPLKILDTAGLRSTEELVESLGVERALSSLEKADLVLLVLDGSEDWGEEDERILKMIGDKRAIIVLNKIDLPLRLNEGELKRYVDGRPLVRISAKYLQGLADLGDSILETVMEGRVVAKDTILISNVRHKSALERAEKSLKDSLSAFRRGFSPDLVAIDLREAVEALGEMTGENTTEEMLDMIFSQFCIGK